MTKKQIRRALQNGLGRGILAVRENPEMYRDLVLWACERDLSFDPQCEGTRAWYDYELISCYSDHTEFRDHIICRFQKKMPDSGWDYAHFSELLSYFAMDGDLVAENALWTKYTELLLKLKRKKKSGITKRNMVECFVHICIALSWEKENYFRIAKDIGELFLTNNNFDAYDFAWLYDSIPKSFNSAIIRKKANSQQLSAYCSFFNELRNEEGKLGKNIVNFPIPEGGRGLSAYLKRKEPELAPLYANKYLTKLDPRERAAALEAFSVCPYPFDPEPILIDAESDWLPLKTAAIEALSNIKNEKVRNFALKNMRNDTENMLPILIKNYIPEDEPYLYELVSNLHIDYSNKSGWHGIYMDIRKLFSPDEGISNPPKSLLPVMYESSICSFCRESIVRLMGKYHMLSQSMWEEQLFDSNDDIRTYAETHFRRIKRTVHQTKNKSAASNSIT